MHVAPQTAVGSCSGTTLCTDTRRRADASSPFARSSARGATGSGCGAGARSGAPVRPETASRPAGRPLRADAGSAHRGGRRDRPVREPRHAGARRNAGHRRHGDARHGGGGDARHGGRRHGWHAHGQRSRGRESRGGTAQRETTERLGSRDHQGRYRYGRRDKRPACSAGHPIPSCWRPPAPRRRIPCSGPIPGAGPVQSGGRPVRPGSRGGRRGSEPPHQPRRALGIGA